MCSKIGYETRKDALTDVAHIQNNKKRFNHKANRIKKCGKKLYVYECPVCDKWHVTTQKQRKRK